jgi:hypothetical protein
VNGRHTLKKGDDLSSSAAANSLGSSDAKESVQFQDNRPGIQYQRRLQNIVNDSPQVQKTAQFQAIANSNLTQSTETKASENKNEVVQGMFANAIRTGARRAAPMLGRGLGYASGAATLAGSGAALNGIYEDGKKRNQGGSPFDKQTVFDMGRETVVTGLGFATGPFGKLGTALSMANNLYDANQARIAAQEKNESPLNVESFEAFAKAEVDKFRGVIDFGVFGKVLDAGMGVEKIISNREALQTRCTEFYQIVQEAEVPEFNPLREI